MDFPWKANLLLAGSTNGWKISDKVFFIKMCRWIEMDVFCGIVQLPIKLPLHKISKN